MNTYITGTTIKELREQRKLTQQELADSIRVSAKAVSKWENMRGLPDISLLEPLAKALQISVVELLSGDCVTNQNKSSNMLRSKLYICPICGNVIHTMGEALVSCCGITLPVEEADAEVSEHEITCTRIDHEYYVSMDHEMTKKHYISFFAYVTSDKYEMVKLYPEGNAEARFAIKGHGMIYAYCNHHGLIQKRV